MMTRPAGVPAITVGARSGLARSWFACSQQSAVPGNGVIETLPTFIAEVYNETPSTREFRPSRPARIRGEHEY